MRRYRSRRSELPLGKISDRLQVRRASVTYVVDKLVGSGYVARLRDGLDRGTPSLAVPAPPRQRNG
jgi:DNA-binding MarR family transcriptional regulator